MQRAISGLGRAISHEDVIAESAVTAIITGLVSTGSPPGTRLAVHEPQALLVEAGREAERALTAKRIHSICAGVNGSPAAMLNNPAPLSGTRSNCVDHHIGQGPGDPVAILHQEQGHLGRAAYAPGQGTVRWVQARLIRFRYRAITGGW